MATGSIPATIEVETSVDFKRIEYSILEAVDDSLDETLAYGEKVAKKHAPVRKITKGGGRVRTRELTNAEIADLPSFVKKGLSPISGTFLSTGRRPRVVTRRSFASMGHPTYHQHSRLVVQDQYSGRFHLKNPESAKLLSSAGRAELASGRAIHTMHSGELGGSGGLNIKHETTSTVGGRLQREIRGRVTRSAHQGGIAEGILESPTEYAPYVEFPTSRTAAQPYMRPAREAMRPHLVTALERNLMRAGRYV